MAEHNEIGKIGEEIAKTFLMKHDFDVLHRNFLTRFGEIDIVAKKDNTLRFVEVKTVKVNSLDLLETLHVKPEDNLTKEKWRHLVASAEIYLKRLPLPSTAHVLHTQTREIRWQIDLACVYVNPESRQGRVIFMENIHKE